jgi:phosphoglycolate phosphatase-like HAD superfamily hydrolase
MDTMNIKHIRCFGPCFVEVYGINENKQKVLDRWNAINLFEITRGINRFMGFARILCELYPEDKDVLAFNEWTKTAKELSEKAVGEVADKTDNPVFKKALEWSKAVNKSINALSDADKKAFVGTKEGLLAARENFDIAIVSSANYAAVVEEWKRCGLLELTDVVTTQTDGSKAYCISELIKKGYDKDKVVMMGDAEGDLKAAESNGVAFYPVLVNHEKQSWEQLPEFLSKFVSGESDLDRIILRKAFYSNLNVEEV